MEGTTVIRCKDDLLNIVLYVDGVFDTMSLVINVIHVPIIGNLIVPIALLSISSKNTKADLFVPSLVVWTIS